MTSAVKFEGSPAQISLQIQGGTGAPRHARRSMLSELQGQFADARLADVALIVSELVTNSVLHANVGSRQTLTVELMRCEDRLRITVIDPGSRLEPRLRPYDCDTPGGLGLLVVDTLSCAWGVARDPTGTTSVWCELPLDPPPPG